MKKAVRFLLYVLLGIAGLAQARTFNQAELDALLAPIALYPDPVLSNVLDASQYPDEVREAAAWTRENPQLKGDDALRALGPAAWQPSVKALAAFPDVLARMDESPQWLQDLGDAYREHGPYVMDTVQQLRRRAQANGNLQSNGDQRVYNDGGAVVVQPAYPQAVYVPYYDPFIVYGAWWWPAYRPVVFRPWPVHRVFVSYAHFPVRCDWPRRHVVVVNHPRMHQVVNHPSLHHSGPRVNAPRPSHGFVPHSPPKQWKPSPQPHTYQRVPESQRQPIVRQQPAVRSMAPTGWRADAPRAQFNQNRGTSRPQGGTQRGHRG